MTRAALVPEKLVVDYNGFADLTIDEIHAKAVEWRALGRVLWTEHNGGHWIVLSSDGCRQVLTSPLYSSREASLVIVERERFIPLELDGADHRSYRRAINPLFAPARIELLGQTVRGIAKSLVKNFAGAGTCEINSEYARPLASAMFLQLMDWPLEDRAWLEHWVEIELNGIAGAPEEEQKRAKSEANTKIRAYCKTMLDGRRDRSTDDMTAALINTTVDGQPIPERQLLGMLVLVMIAGLDTTQSVISRSVGQLAAHADLQRHVRDHPDEIRMIIEELLRFGAPGGCPNRIALEDNVVEGVPIAAGDRVHCMIQVANRDADEFEHPALIDFSRVVNRHMTFGLGPHKCIGATLARLVFTTALQELHNAIGEYTLRSETSHIGGVWGMNSVYIDFAPVPAD